MSAIKNCELHASFPDAQLRQFLGKAAYPYVGASAANLRRQIADLQAELAKAEKTEAAQLLLTERGWSLHDVSDDIADYAASAGRGDYFGFVGTGAELEALLAKHASEEE